MPASTKKPKHSDRKPVVYEADEDAVYDEVIEIDLSTLKPTVAYPHLPENTKTIDEAVKDDLVIDQVVIGSCTNGRMDDLRIAAKILEGKTVAKGMRLIVIPGTQQIYLDAIKEGLVQTFINAGGVVSTPTCGPCLGGYMGVMAAGERCVSTTNRNFVGRMGHVEFEGYFLAPVAMWLRAIVTVGALGLMMPGIITDAVGAACLVGLWFMQKQKAKALGIED